MGQIALDDEMKFSFLFNDCGIHLPIVEKYIFENMWDDNLSFHENAFKCQEIEIEMMKLYNFKVTINFGLKSKQPNIISVFSSLEEATLFMKKDILKKYNDKPTCLYHYEKHSNGLLLFSEITFSEKNQTYTIRNYSGKDNVILPEHKTTDITEAYYTAMKFIHSKEKDFEKSYFTDINYGYYWHDIYNHEQDYQIKIEYSNKI